MLLLLFSRFSFVCIIFLDVVLCHWWPVPFPWSTPLTPPTPLSGS